MLQAPSTARRAGQWIAVTTLVVSTAGGVAIWLFDREEFPSLESGMWWAVQTVTTVGYGDHVPADGLGRVIATVVMLAGIGFLSVVTASISAAFVESARRRRGRATDDLLLERMERIERALEELRASRER